MSPSDKRNALASGLPDKLLNRLFFQARNLAIEAMLLRLDNLLLRKGFNARCEWHESSFGGPVLLLKMFNPKPGQWEYGSCRAFLKREHINAPDEMSPSFYSVASVKTAEYWPRKQPQQLLDFRSAVAALAETGELAREVEKVNFPFDYQRLSVF